VFGEVGLAGEVRGTTQGSLRVREAAMMGFTRCVLPPGACAPVDLPGLPGLPAGASATAGEIELVEVRTVSEALDALMDW
jgi:DNA repair protein RadA/Sms